MNTVKPSPQTCELLSALADGELRRDEIAEALDGCQQDGTALVSWNVYNLIGEVLRAPAPSVRGADMAFLDRLNQRLALEPAATAVLQVLPAPTAYAKAQLAEGSNQQRGDSANDGNFRWKLVAGFASLTAVAAIAWNTSGLLASPNAVQLAQGAVQQQVLVASPQGPVVRDARLEELLAAHRQLGGASALQVPSGFLRNATFEIPQNADR